MDSNEPREPLIEQGDMPEGGKNASSKVTVGGRGFFWVERKDGKNRGFTIKESIEGSKEVEYRAYPSPINEDEKWYHSNVERWYREAAEAAAGDYVKAGTWRNINNVKIHKVTYDFKLR